jgi:hypothetical protein
MLFRYPGRGVQNWGLSISPELLHTKKLEVEEWDINQFLPTETYEWCQSALTSIGFSFTNIQLLTDKDRESPLFNTYIELRAAIQLHLQSGDSPELSLLQSPSQRNLNTTHDLSGVQSIELEFIPNED